jgi:hypothetical protein
MRWPAAATVAAVLAFVLGCRQNPSRVRIDTLPATEGGSGSTSPPTAASIPAQEKFSFTRAEARSIEVFLAKNPDLRLAGDTDARSTDDSEDVAKLYSIYHPYFVRGDVNDDGALDFVVGFVDRKRPGGPPWFTIVAFCSDGKGTFRDPEVLEREVSLERGDISIDRDCIVVTPDLGDDSSRRYRWNSLHRRFEFVSEDDGKAEPRPINRI